jgi:hypothetical protein
MQHLTKRASWDTIIFGFLISVHLAAAAAAVM